MRQTRGEGVGHRRVDARSGVTRGATGRSAWLSRAVEHPAPASQHANGETVSHIVRQLTMRPSLLRLEPGLKRRVAKNVRHRAGAVRGAISHAFEFGRAPKSELGALGDESA